MKTTIDISDALLSEAKLAAAAQGTTLRKLVEAGLRQALGQTGQAPKPFKLRNASFKGQGLAQGVQPSDWERIREMAYEGRGGV
jgi:Arc/MetJ family transcription regulator